MNQPSQPLDRLALAIQLTVAAVTTIAGCSRSRESGASAVSVTREIDSGDVGAQSHTAVRVDWADSPPGTPAQVLARAPLESTSFERAHRVGTLVPANDILVESVTGALYRITSGGGYENPVASTDGREVAFSRRVAGVGCGEPPEFACYEVWTARTGAEPIQRTGAPFNAEPRMGLGSLRFAANDARLFFDTNGGFAFSSCLWSLALADAKLTVVACDAATLDREVTKGPFANTLIVSWSPLLPGGGREWNARALFTVDGKRIRDLPSDPKAWPSELRNSGMPR